MARRETCVMLVPSILLAVVQAPMIGLSGALRRHSFGNSTMIAVTLSSSNTSRAPSGGPSGLLKFTRSNVSPRLTTNGSLRCATNTRPGGLQPGVGLVAPGDGDTVNVAVNIGFIVGQRFAADIIHRFGEKP